jgi:hypothetical protein
MLGGCASTAAVSSLARPQAPATTALHVIVQPRDLEFVTAHGTFANYPRRPLVPGDRVLGSDDIIMHGTAVGRDYEACTISFDRHALCDDVIDLGRQGTLHVAWMLQWPASGAAGPPGFDGEVLGGTRNLARASGTFTARTLANHDLDVTLTMNR